MPQALTPLEVLENTFGSTLQCLNTSEKLHLISILSIREQQVEDGDNPNEYHVTTAYADHPFAGTASIDRCCEILDFLPSRQTRALLLALANQINQP